MASLDILLVIPRKHRTQYEIYPYLVRILLSSSFFLAYYVSKSSKSPDAGFPGLSPEAMLKRGGSMQSLLSLGSRRSNRSLDAEGSDFAKGGGFFRKPHEDFFGMEANKWTKVGEDDLTWMMEVQAGSQ